MRIAYLLIFQLLLLAASPAQEPSTVSRAEQKLKAWRDSRASALMDDFGELSRYRKSNALLGTPAAGEDRVVFLGDSITDGWDLKKYFPQKAYVNRGISGQTTSQMLLRFGQDVVSLKPRAVVILAGTNDIAGNTGPMSLQEIENNFASMAEIASANHIRVILSSVLPVHNYTSAAEDYYALRPMEQILALNRWLKAYCEARGHIYLDYFAPMLDQSGLLKRELADDGLHPNPAGYTVMVPLADAAITKALQKESTEKAKPGN